MKHTRKNKDERIKFQLSKEKNKKELTQSQKAFVEGLKEARENPKVPTQSPYSSWSSNLPWDWRTSWCFGHYLSNQNALERQIADNPDGLLPMIKCQKCGKRLRVVQKPLDRRYYGSGDYIIPLHKKRVTTSPVMQYEDESWRQKQRRYGRKQLEEYKKLATLKKLTNLRLSGRL